MNIPAVWEICGRSANEGPNVCILGGVHGDEILGVHIVKELLEKFDLVGKPYGTYKSDQIALGRLYLGFGNPVAILQNTRYASSEEVDLNRSFGQAELNAPPTAEDRYDLTRARELMPLFRKTDFLFDIHSTTSPSVPFVCMGNVTSEHLELCRLVPVDFILSDPDTVLPRDLGRTELGTTDYAVNQFGGSSWSTKKYGRRRGIGFAYESGYKKDLQKHGEVSDTIRRLLVATGTLDEAKETVEPIEPRIQTVYRLAEIIHAEYHDFEFKEGMNEGWRRLSKGELLGTYASNGKQLYAPVNGALLFPSGKKPLCAGDTLCYVATEL